ncbi:MAG: AAA family ATPase, partial [Nanoarchaeota archaeon]|nr:AAA family ATPase [Nanoarchaeota archaeon]
FYREDWVQTGIEGLDSLLEKGIPRGTSVIVAGGPGSGKTILCLQAINNAVKKGENAIYISLEEHPFRLEKHMHDFGWNPENFIKKGLLKIIRVDPFAIARDVEALLAKAKGELMIDFEEVASIMPQGFKPKWVILDSISALESAFKDDEDTYRLYIQQLFRYFERLGVTSLLVSETENIPKKYSRTGVEEFLADGVMVLYHLKKGNIRERAIEILKMRGSAHQSKIVAMQIISEVGIEVYPEQEIFGGIEE